jgi:hypothetical protein
VNGQYGNLNGNVQGQSGRLSGAVNGQSINLDKSQSEQSGDANVSQDDQASSFSGIQGGQSSVQRGQSVDQNNSSGQDNQTATQNEQSNGDSGASNLQSNANGPSQGQMFNDPGVRQQLRMNQAQYNRMNHAYTTAYNRYNSALSNFNAQDRASQTPLFQSRFQNEIGTYVNGNLTDPQMPTRFEQLRRQFSGANAFNDPSVQRQLNLTPDQRTQLRALATQFEQQIQQFRATTGGELTNANTSQWRQLWTEYGNQQNSILTAEQRQSWSQQIGEPYPFSPGAFFGTQLQQAGASQANDRTSTAGRTSPTAVQGSRQPGTVEAVRR